MTSVNAELFHREQDKLPSPQDAQEPCQKCGAATPTQCECPREVNAHGTGVADMQSKDPYANDTAPDFEGLPATASWADIFSVEELCAALDLHAAKAAKAGNYGLATDLGFASAAILQLSDELDTALGRAITAKPL